MRASRAGGCGLPCDRCRPVVRPRLSGRSVGRGSQLPQQVIVVVLDEVGRVRLPGRQRDVVVAVLGCLQRTGIGLLLERGPIGLLFAETLIKRVAPVFVDVVQASRQGFVALGWVVLVAGHLCGIGLSASQGRVRVGGGVIPGQVFGMLGHTLMMDEGSA